MFTEILATFDDIYLTSVQSKIIYIRIIFKMRINTIFENNSYNLLNNIFLYLNSIRTYLLVSKIKSSEHNLIII